MSENSFKHMSVSELQAVMADKSHIVVDIRDANSFVNGRIVDAIHLTNESLADFIREADPDAPVVVCCYHGISSQQAAEFLISQDFTDVYSLDGGFTQWQIQFPDNIER
ncbi:thiosulfate sulfurtransferase GlpE [Colwellia psychrerythraea]|uniref:Thiosulfate sulfurtransferase GlpE n=1 Tax=Colwellia psychrerythraea TaxID=28229 RepID=A0A099L678_COLPS|nr:thiosulfate sulfurtransferase GlpE [Colwellia psychrerythraea]KGJ97607.1 Thiosulfate sulfurtransferase [Colwellia psychrerythraea]